MGGGVVAPVWRPAVMHRYPGKAGQDPCGVHRLHAALGMDREPAQQRGRGRVDPVQPAANPGAGLVEVDDLSAGELPTHRLGEPAQLQ